MRDYLVFFGFFIHCCAQWHQIDQVVGTDNESAGMHTGLAYGTFEHLGIFQGVGEYRVRRIARLPQFFHVPETIAQIYLDVFPVFILGKFTGYEFGEPVSFRKRQFLDTCHIFDGRFCSHGAIGYDVCHPFFAVFFGHPAHYLATLVVLEVDVDIGQ